ncbi:TrmH family RNA methyltransferase [Ornithinimicrobium sp. W1665]|uniref:TrmH family RNA methyltransferase n=1 Tax=Ornithinimicrobium sp. W1665 TaxID=3416666 RepID=UPI003CFA0B08
MTEPPPLRTPRSERVRQVAALGRRAARDRQGRFLVEGPQAVRELVGYAASAAEALYVTPAALERHGPLVEEARALGVRVQECTEEVLRVMAGTEHPQGLLAVAGRVDVPLDRALDAVGTTGFVVVLAHVRDPGNAGTVLRAADAFGASAVLVSAASVDVYNPKVVRSTVGSLFHLPVSVGTPVGELLEACRARGIRLLAADGSGPTPLPDVDLTGPHAWVMGNEAWGLPPEVLDGCDDVVSVPIRRAESLNLAMAATVCLHASSARTHAG